MISTPLALGGLAENDRTNLGTIKGMCGLSYLFFLLCCAVLLAKSNSSNFVDQKLPTRRFSISTNVQQKAPEDESAPAPPSTPSSHYLGQNRHHTCPPQTIEELRKRYGDSKNEWSIYDTRQFYKQQLPRALQVDGFLGLSLEDRAKLAARSRNVVRKYARERCGLPASVAARFFDGVRHLQHFGYWRTDGLSWEELKAKYIQQVTRLDPNATPEEIELNVYRMILDKSCSTNKIFDDYCDKKISIDQLVGLMRSLAYFDRGSYSARADRDGEKKNIPLGLFPKPLSTPTAVGSDEGNRLLTPIQVLLILDAFAIGTNLPNM